MGKKKETALDKEIARIYHENCSGIQVPIMEISNIYKAAKKAHEEGKDMKEAILAYVEKVKVN